MTSEDIYNDLKAILGNVANLNSLSDLNYLVKVTGLESHIENFYIKYPILSFHIEKTEIENLKLQDVLTIDNKLDTKAFKGTTLEKLLIAVLWKNGDLNKLQHIVDGILQTEGFRTEHSLIFKQFGHSLVSPIEPIVDQHTLRAFEIGRLTKFSETKVNSLRKKSIYKSADRIVLDEYRIWFLNTLKQISEHEKNDFKEKLDKILFLKGKAAKT